MNPQEEQALELAKEGVKQLAEPAKDVLQRLLGPAASEIGLAWGDYLRVWRTKRIFQYLKDLKEVADKAHIELKAVAPRLLFPILEAASLEEDADLYTRWIGLLTNAATTDYEGQILPCFPDILRQLTSEEAQFMDRAYDETTQDAEKRHAEVRATNPEFKGDLGILGLSGRVFGSVHPVLIENLERLMLVTRTNVPLSFDDKMVHTFPPANHLYISELGKAFVRACRVPKADLARNEVS